MQFPITIGLHRSFLGGLIGALIHGGAAIAVVLTPWAVWVRAVLAVAVVVSALLARRSGRPAVTALRLLGNGRVECRLEGDSEFRSAELQPGNTVHPWLSVIRLSVDMRPVTVVMLPDSATTEEFRRLRVWLRWRADFSAGKDAA
ncbi:MAG TPA: protein YgfX [Rhodocyclaceae bacterium]|nr:protein YgfX [Rhodocyclaceae bacterium]